MVPHPSAGNIWIFAFVLGLYAPCILADFGSCILGWEWANNTLNQNPCQIAGTLEASCGNYSAYVLGPLSQGTNYITPQKNDSFAQECNCNTVMYSLYMACTGCQNVSIQTWQFWAQYCKQVYVTQWPEKIPQDTAVPHWAYLNWTVGGIFDPSIAMSDVDKSESMAPSPSTATLPSTPTNWGSPSPSETGPFNSANGGNNNDSNSNVNSNVNSKNSSHSGLIAGGVIGGFAFLVVVCVGILMFRRKRATPLGHRDCSDHNAAHHGSSMSEHGIPHFQTRFYDPSDPSTFPEKEPSVPYTTASSGRYSGAAEL